MRHVLIAAAGVLGGFSGHIRAQAPETTASLDTDERIVMYERYMEFPSLVLGGAVTPHWLADGSRFWFMENAPDSAVAVLVDPNANTQSPLFEISRVRSGLAEVLGHQPPYDALPFETFAFVEEPGEKPGRIRFVVEDTEFEMDLAGYTAQRTGRSAVERKRHMPRLVRHAFPATTPDVYEARSPDRRWFALDKDYDLWLRSSYDDRLERLTDDGEEWYSWSVGGPAEGIVGAADWSPAGTRIAALKTDNRHVHKVPLVHWLKPHEEVEWWPFTKAGGPLPYPELHILDVLSKEDVQVDTGSEPGIHLGTIGWRPDGSEFLFTRMNRGFNRLDVMAADPKTGASRIVVTETQPTFIKGISINPSLSELFTLIADGERFLWISERDGWDHIYLYDLDGTLIRRLTSGEWPVRRVVAVDEDRGWVYFTAHGDMLIDPNLGAPRRYDTHLYRVRLDGGEVERLTNAPGEHSIVFAPSKHFFLDTHSSTDRPPVVELRTAAGEFVREVSHADLSGIDDLGWSAPEEFVVLAADGETELHGVLFKPRDFDPSREYPVIDYIYGGPYRTQTPREFIGVPRLGPYAHAIAQLGYVVMMVDARGTPERGKAFQDVVYGNFGRHEIPDHVAALEGVAATRPWIDTDRVGIFGSSWGGYMTVRAMVLAPEVYDVGISIYPVVDLYDHMALALEPYMGVPNQRPEAFDYGSSVRLADRLEGKLLLMHGTNDVNATFSATMKMVEALNRAGKPYDLIVFPDQSHALTGHATQYRLDAIVRYFLEHLPPE